MWKLLQSVVFKGSEFRWLKLGPFFLKTLFSLRQLLILSIFLHFILMLFKIKIFKNKISMENNLLHMKLPSDFILLYSYSLLLITLRFPLYLTWKLVLFCIHSEFYAARLCMYFLMKCSNWTFLFSLNCHFSPLLLL